MKHVKIYEEFVNENMKTLKRFLHDFRMDHGRKIPSEQTLAQFIYDNYEDVTGEKLKNSDPESNYHIADIVAHFKMDGEDFMIAWEDTVNANK